MFWQATIANVLMVHGGVAMVTLLLLGAIFPIHIARAWRGRLNRVSGSIMVICNAVLIATAFGLYYLPNTPSSVWKTGLERSGKAVDGLVQSATSPSKYSASPRIVG